MKFYHIVIVIFIHSTFSNFVATISRKKRGITRGINTERLAKANDGKLLVEVPQEVGAPVGENATRFATWLGVQIRTMAPLKDFEKWDDIPSTMKAPILQATRVKLYFSSYFILD